MSDVPQELLSFDELIQKLYISDDAVEILTNMGERQFASLYMIVSKGDGVNFTRIHGFGIVYARSLSARWSDYKSKYKWLNDRDHGMVVIVTKTAEDYDLTRFTHFSDEIYVLEGLAHLLRGECNERFITNPGANNQRTNFHLQDSYLHKLHQSQDLLSSVRQMINSALEKNEYVTHQTAPQMIRCRLCAYENANRSTFSQHACYPKRALDAIGEIEDEDKSKFSEKRCKLCGTTQVRADKLQSRHIGNDSCVVLKGRNKLIELVQVKPEFFRNCDLRIGTFIELLTGLLPNDEKTRKLASDIRELQNDAQT